MILRGLVVIQWPAGPHGPFWGLLFSGWNWPQSYHQKFQVPRMEVLSLIGLFWGWVSPYISLTYSLHRWGSWFFFMILHILPANFNNLLTNWHHFSYPKSSSPTWRIIRVGKWLITIVNQSPKDRVVGPLLNGLFTAYAWGWSEPLTIPGVILQVGVGWL